MVRKVILAICIASLFITYGSERNAFADGGSDFFGHAVRRYDNVIQSVETDEKRFLTKDSVEAVREFFEQARQKGDRVDPVELKGMSAYNLVYAGPEVQRPMLLVSFEEREPDANIHPALGELKAQTMMGRHSMQEYEALASKYGRLHLSFFREVDDGQGGSVSEGEKIYRAAYAQVHGPTKAAMKSQAPGQSQKAEAAALKQQMQEMKSKGDIAGMMQMARNFTPAPDQTGPGATAMKAAGGDTWDVWVRCLQDIEAVAYRTRISYSNAAWK